MRNIDVEALAHEILVRHGVAQPPIQIDQIASAEGALIARTNFAGQESGFALRETGRWVIGVNSRTSPRRQRFTVAHELGHLLLHEGRRLTVDHSILVNRRDEVSSLGTDQDEVDANRFAAAVLMPEELLRQRMQIELNSRTAASRDELIARLARTFDVSNEAMGYRLINLNMITA